MDPTWILILSATISVFAAIGVGVVTRWLGWLTEEADDSLLKLIIRVLFPCLIFTVISSNPVMKRAGNLFLPPLVGFSTVVLGLAVAYTVARVAGRWFGLRDARQCRTFALCVGMYNYGFVPIPLVKMLFDDRTLGVLFVHNVGVDLALWTVGMMLLVGSLEQRWWRHLINPPSCTILVAVILNFLGVADRLPDFLTRTLDWLGHAAIPLSLVLIGATVADQLRPGGDRTGFARSAGVVSVSCILRLGMLPVAFMTLAWFLSRWIPSSVELQRVVVVEAAMPSAVFPIVMARHYGGHPGTALRVALGTSIVALLTIPVWISLGTSWFDLMPTP